MTGSHPAAQRRFLSALLAAVASIGAWLLLTLAEPAANGVGVATAGRAVASAAWTSPVAP